MLNSIKYNFKYKYKYTYIINNIKQVFIKNTEIQ